jgi:hypothetical protein
MAAGGMFLAGNVLVLSSMWALGLTGTYLGTHQLPQFFVHFTFCAFCVLRILRFAGRGGGGVQADHMIDSANSITFLN